LTEIKSGQPTVNSNPPAFFAPRPPYFGEGCIFWGCLCGADLVEWFYDDVDGQALGFGWFLFGVAG